MPAPRAVVVQPPRVVNRYTPGPVRTVYRPGPTRFIPGPTVTRNYYNTIVRPDRGAIERARVAQSNWDREHFRLERIAAHDQAAAARLQFLQQQLYQAQQAQQIAAQQQQAAQQPPAMVQNMPQPAPSVSPASPAVDLTPHQDAADGGGGGDDGGGGGGDDGGGGGGGHGGEEHAGHKPHHLLLFVGLIGIAGVGGYMLMHKKKPAAKKPD
jgi:hypothetical protein